MSLETVGGIHIYFFNFVVQMVTKGLHKNKMENKQVVRDLAARI